MDRRAYLSTAGALAVGGCLSNPTSDHEAPLDSDENWTDTVVADESFDDAATPICVDGDDRNGTVETHPGSTITAHHFFHDPQTGRYGVRGRLEIDQGGYMQTVRATFRSAGRDIATETRAFIDPTADAYRFLIATTEGDPTAVDEYVLSEPDGATDSPGPTIDDGTELLESAWGRLGTADGDPVYGAVATVRNATDATGDAVVIVEAFLEDGTGVLNQKETVTLDPDDTHTLFVPYRHCDPGAVARTDVRHWLADY